jgi:two-component system CheB/CheR fusion protein
MTARRIAESLKRPHPIGRQSVYPSASIGICLYPNDGDDVETLLKNADSAMYQAKDGGKSTHHFFTDALRQAADERLRMETGLRGAVVGNELHLLFQPQIDIRTGRLLGAEALLRWKHPEDGLIPPDRFIPLAEKSGLIDEIGEWVTDAACRQMATWIAKGHAIPRISINVSPEQMRRTNLTALMRRQLSHYRLDASRVALELTESALVDDVERVQQMLRELKTLGVQLSIDDFGTGYSSLAYLRRFPLDEVKIDKSFVTDIGHNVDDRTIAQTILAMSQTMGFSVVAEGIETEEQLAVLRDMGCDVGQGYLFARPLSAEDLVSQYCLN